MIKDILIKSFEQGKNREIISQIWSWIYANTNNENIYYGTVKEICEACKTDYPKIKKAFDLQNSWNRKDFEKTIILKKDTDVFEPIDGFHKFNYYQEMFDINLVNLKSQYNPLIIIFNNKPYSDIKAVKKSNVVSQLTVMNDLPIPVKTQPKTMKDKLNDPQHKIDMAIRNACLDVYIDWFKQRNGLEPKIDGTQINALMSIITWLKKNKKNAPVTDIVSSFNVIFQNWGIYPPFYQSQVKLTQISSNITTFVEFIKQNITSIDKSKTAKIFKLEKDIQDVIDSGQLDDAISKLGQDKYAVKK